MSEARRKPTAVEPLFIKLLLNITNILRNAVRSAYGSPLAARSGGFGSGELRGVDTHLAGLGEVLLDIFLALIAQERDHRAQLGERLLDLPRGEQVRPAARPHEEAVLLGQAAHGVDGFLGVNGEGLAHEASVALEDAGDEAVGDALDQVVPHLPAQDGRGLRGLHREELDVWVDLAEGLPDADERTTRAHTRHHRIRDGALGELGEGLRPQDGAVLLHVPLRLELRREEVAGPLPHLPRPCYGLIRLEMTDLEHLGTVGLGDGSAFAAKTLGRNHEHPVTLHGGDHREGVTHVASSRLYDGVARFDQALLLGPLYHVLGDARLDGA